MGGAKAPPGYADLVQWGEQRSPKPRIGVRVPGAVPEENVGSFSPGREFMGARAPYGSVAQSVEQRTVNPWAAGSSPAVSAIGPRAPLHDVAQRGHFEKGSAGRPEGKDAPIRIAKGGRQEHQNKIVHATRRRLTSIKPKKPKRVLVSATVACTCEVLHGLHERIGSGVSRPTDERLRQ